MNITWCYTFISVLIVSLIGFAGAITLPFKGDALKRIISFLVSFSAGALFGDAFLHLLPEAVEKNGFNTTVSLSLLSGIILFFVLEKIIHWRHCHIETSKEHPHPVAWMNLIGDAFHNSLDGMVIAGSFVASPALGISTTIAVILHEIPQEIGNYGILIHGGFGRIKALFLNFGVQLTSIIGAFLILFLAIKIDSLTAFLIPFTAGGFIYIAGSDLFPEMKKEVRISDSIQQLLSILLGVGLMLLLKLVG